MMTKYEELNEQDYTIINDILVIHSDVFKPGPIDLNAIKKNFTKVIFANAPDISSCALLNNDECHHHGSIFSCVLNLKNGITHLIFGCHYDESITLVDSLTHLTFGYIFNQPIRLTDQLTHLTFGYKFNQPIVLPDNLTHLIFDIYFSHSLILPSSLIHLEINGGYNKIDLPNGLKYFKCDYVDPDLINKLPIGLTHLILGSDDFDSPLDNLPNSLTHLILGSDFNSPLNNLPNSLTHLILGSDFDSPLNNLPNQLKSIVFDSLYYSHDLNNLPSSIESIVLPRTYKNKNKKN